MGLSLLAFGRVAVADPEPGNVAAMATGSASKSASAPTALPTANNVPRPDEPISSASTPVASTQADPLPIASTEVESVQCTQSALEEYARRKSFTQQLIEQRARQNFESDLASYARRRAFTERLTQQRAQMSEAARKQFDEQVERYVRLREITLRIQDEHDLRDALAFADDLALQERKRVFTRKLVESRAQRQTNLSASGAKPQ